MFRGKESTGEWITQNNRKRKRKHTQTHGSLMEIFRRSRMSFSSRKPGSRSEDNIRINLKENLVTVGNCLIEKDVCDRRKFQLNFRVFVCAFRPEIS